MSKKKSSPVLCWLKPVLFALAGGLLFLFAILCAFAMIASKLFLSAGIFVWLDTVAICLSGFVSAQLLAQQRKAGGLACGLFMFGVYAVTLGVLEVAAGGNVLSLQPAVRCAGLLIGCCIGGMLGVRSAEKSSHRRRTAA